MHLKTEQKHQLILVLLAAILLLCLVSFCLYSYQVHLDLQWSQEHYMQKQTSILQDLKDYSTNMRTDRLNSEGHYYYAIYVLDVKLQKLEECMQQNLATSIFQDKYTFGFLSVNALLIACLR